MLKLGLGSGVVTTVEQSIDEGGIPAGRLYARAKKLAALLALGEPNPTVRDGILLVPEHWVEVGVRIAERGNAYALRAAGLLSRSRDEAVTGKILAQLLKHPKGLTLRELQQFTHCKNGELKQNLELLGEDGSVEAVEEGRTTRYRRIR
jgi:hypothetical protein